MALVACGGGSPATIPAPVGVEPSAPSSAQIAAGACVVADSMSSGADTVRIAVFGPLHAHDSEVPQSEGDHFVFRQMYETLTRIDCEQSLLPALAAKWTGDESGSVWTFELTPGLTFADGSPIDANAVVESFNRRLNTPAAWPHVTAVQATGVRSVQLRFDAPQQDAPRILSDSRFAILGASSTNSGPSESGPYRIAAEQLMADGTASAVILSPSDPRSRGAILKFVVVPPNTDLRDALDRGIGGVGMTRADVLVTRDPDVLSYAARRDELRTMPLPWDRTYVLLAQSEASLPSSLFPLPSAPERTALARDAVTANSRGAEPPFWWQQDSTCATPAAPHLESMRREVGYAAGDPTARELAERIVALATSSARPAWIPGTLPSELRAQLRITPVPADSVDNAIGSGEVAAAVVAYPRDRPTACAGSPRRTLNRIEIPLVDSRAHVIVRRTGIAFLIDGDGGIHFSPGAPGRP